MVPVCWALASADVSAGTASAARIAIIAITTSNSIRVNAEEGLFILIFIWVFFSFCGCSEGLLRRVLSCSGVVCGGLGACFGGLLFWGEHVSIFAYIVRIVAPYRNA